MESLFNKVLSHQACNFIKKPPAQVFSSEICEIFKNNCFEEHLWTTAFGKSYWQILKRLHFAILLVKGFVQVVQRKKLTIAPFIKGFKSSCFVKV